MIIKIVESQKEIFDNFKIRKEVFIVGQNVAENLELDGLDEYATLIVAYVNQVIVGCGRYRLVENFAKIERIAVLENYRNQGIATKIMEFIEETIKSNTKIELLKLNSQISAENFYKKLNFIPKGNIFLEADIEHISMIKAI